MKNLKHTQGEWNVIKHGNNDSFGIYAEGSGNDLAIVKGGNEEGGEAEANSKLIAASPQLLRHLVKCVEALELIGKETGQSMPLTVADAKEAINKAIN